MELLNIGPAMQEFHRVNYQNSLKNPLESTVHNTDKDFTKFYIDHRSRGHFNPWVYLMAPR